MRKYKNLVGEVVSTMIYPDGCVCHINNAGFKDRSEDECLSEINSLGSFKFSRKDPKQEEMRA
jgi:hypothetical protein